MNKPRQVRDTAGAYFFEIAPRSGSFFAMAIEEWWKLVADVAHAFAGKPSRPADAIEEKRLGDQ